MGSLPLAFQRRTLKLQYVCANGGGLETIMGFENGLKTIVVATDLEGQAEAALEYARKLATHYGARIVLAHGLDPMEYATVGSIPADVLSHMTKAARKVLDQLAGELLGAGIH